MEIINTVIITNLYNGNSCTHTFRYWNDGSYTGEVVIFNDEDQVVYRHNTKYATEAIFKEAILEATESAMTIA